MEAKHSKLEAKKILLVEDNEMNVLLFKMMLKRAGAIVVSASNGHSALQLFVDQDFDVVLTDIHLNGMDGDELAKQIRNMQDPVKQNVPIIVLTASFTEAEHAAYVLAGANFVLGKPFKEQALKEAIERLLQL